MSTIEHFDLIEAMNRHSRRVTLWQESGMDLDFEALANEMLGEKKCQYASYWDYYNDQEASDLFDRIIATGLVTYYAAPREDFSRITGLRKGAEDGSTFVMMEDMS